jgi:hypothetical protein
VARAGLAVAEGRARAEGLSAAEAGRAGWLPRARGGPMGRPVARGYHEPSGRDGEGGPGWGTAENLGAPNAGRGG